MKMRPFQLAVLTGFGLIALLGLAVLATYRAKPSAEDQLLAGGIHIWGTLPSTVVRESLDAAYQIDKRFGNVQYEQKDPATLEFDFLDAVSRNAAPDLLILSNHELFRMRDRLLAIPFDTVPARTFKDTYADGSEIFMDANGSYALPVAIDPMVMYWNRDIFSSSRRTQPPTTYEQLVSDTVPALTIANEQARIAQSALGMGEAANITHASDIFALLAIQSGATLVHEEGGAYKVDIDTTATANTDAPGVAALTFFTQFSDPQNKLYTWNRSLPNDKLYFVGNTLGLYFGFASEYNGLKAQNPNLNFDLAPVPQPQIARITKGYGTFYGFAIPLAAKNRQGSFFVANQFTGPALGPTLAEKLGMASARRDHLAQQGATPVQESINAAAIIARGWLDPKPVESDKILRDMIEQVTSGRTAVGAAVTDASRKLEQLLIPR